MGIERWFDVAVGRRARALHAELLEQERERFLEFGADFRPNSLWEIPEPLLEGTDCFLAALVDELLFGVTLLPLLFGFPLHPLVQLPTQIIGQGGMIHDDRLEIRRQVDLDRLALRELGEGFRRQRRSAVLTGAAQTV